MIKAVIFDMDGVVINSVPMHIQVFQELGLRYGYHIDGSMLAELNGMSTEAVAELLVSRFGLKVEARALAGEKRSIAKERLFSRVRLFPGALDVLKKVKALGYLVGLGTSSPRGQVEAVLPAVGLDFEFDAVVAGDEVADAKPAPDIFLKCAKLLGARPEECAVVEDAPNGIAAAKACGMKAIGISSTSPPEYLGAADAVVSDIRQLSGELLERLGREEA